MCPKEFMSGISLSNHMRIHSKDKNIGKAVVDIPKKNIEDAKDVEDKLSCDKCQKTFKLKIMLKRHQKVCEKIPQLSPRKELLISLEPIDAVLPKPQQHQKIECDLCTTRFKTMDNLEKHMRVVHAAVVKKDRKSIEPKVEVKIAVPCLYCQNIFDDYYTHSAHFSVCSKRDDSKPFTCPLCERVMAKKASYFIHLKNMHFWAREKYMESSPAKNDLECRMCHMKLASQDQLIKHLAAHMSNVEDDDDDGVEDAAESRYVSYLLFYCFGFQVFSTMQDNNLEYINQLVEINTVRILNIDSSNASSLVLLNIENYVDQGAL